MWKRIVPPQDEEVLPDPRERLQPVEWSRELEAKLVYYRHNTRMSCQELAKVINSQKGTLFSKQSRDYTKRDIQRQLKKIFPSELDVVHTMCALKEMRAQKGWSTLRYWPEWTQTERGITIASLTVEMPHAHELAKRFGNVVHVDCTFGTLIYGHKVCRTPLTSVFIMC